MAAAAAVSDAVTAVLPVLQLLIWMLHLLCMQ